MLAAKAETIIREIVNTIGPRLACSNEERRAADWMAARFRENGFETSVVPFRSVPSFTLTFGLLAVAGLGAYWQCVPVAGFLVSAVMLAEVLTFPVFSAVLGLFWRSCNAEGFKEASEISSQTLVFTAHIDSALETDIRSPRLSRLLLGLLIIAPSVINVGTLLLLVGAPPAFVEIVRAPAALFLLGCTVIMARQLIVGGPTPGAGDNASGMAALAMAVSMMPALRYTDVWVVGTGSEEAGLFGMVSFLRRRRLDKKTTGFVNLDQLGAGRLLVITKGGMVVPLSADIELTQAAERASAIAGFNLDQQPFRSMSTDACACMIRGYRAVSLMAGFAHWHQATDIPENIQGETAARAAQTAAGIARLLDKAATGTPAL